MTLEPIGEFNLPMFVTSYPEDPDKLLVVERPGRVQLVEGGTRSVFLDATQLIGTIEGEQGLQSIAPSPDFATSGRLYAFYAGSVTGGDIQVDEFTAAGDAVDLSTRRPVLTIEHSDRPRHYGGQMEFGPDGYLYITTGDGDRVSENAQDLDRRLGKVLRIDPRESGPARYTVPPDNPFVGSDDRAADEIWSYGLRNPFSLAFDRVTGALAIADVGRRAREEIDYDDAVSPGRGANFGWACFEGTVVNQTGDQGPACASPQNLIWPIFEYDRTDQNCAIIGGRVVRAPEYVDLVGRYLYTDLCAGQLGSLVPAVPAASGDREEGLDLGRPVSIDEDCAGHIYVSTLTNGVAGTGDVLRLVGDDPGAPALECDPPSLPGGPGVPPSPEEAESGPTPPGDATVNGPADVQAPRLSLGSPSDPARRRRPSPGDEARQRRGRDRLGETATRAGRKQQRPWRLVRAGSTSRQRGSALRPSSQGARTRFRREAAHQVAAHARPGPPRSCRAAQGRSTRSSLRDRRHGRERKPRPEGDPSLASHSLAGAGM